MKCLLASLVYIAGLGIAQAGVQLSLEDILLLTERGVSDETVLVFLETREIGFTPGAEDIDKLLAAGVSEDVIQYLLRQTAVNSALPYPYRTITYVDRYPPYYYTPYYSGTSVYLGYSGFPHAWFRQHHGGAHHTSLHHGVVHHNREHNDVAGIGHVGATSATHRARHTTKNHKSRGASHRGGNSSRHSGGHSGHGGGH